MQALLVFGPLLVFIGGAVGFLVWDFRRDSARTAKILVRMAEDPLQVREVQLHDNDPIMIHVRIEDERPVQLSGITGVEAVQTFESYKKVFTNAHFQVFQNGRPIKTAAR